MGVEESWQARLPRRRWLLPRWLGRNDGSDAPQRRSRQLLIAGGTLALLAMILARALPGRRASPAAVPVQMVVVAAADIGFGERLTQEKLKLVALPARQLPGSHFQRLDQLITPGGHAALRPIVANEVITASALAAGATRLSTAPLLAPGMRALALPVDEIAGVSGLVFPGDRVDVLMTEEPEEAMPHAELLAQDLRVLAVGVDMNVARDAPGVVKSITLEVTAAQAQKLTLAAATGTLRLALRRFGDSDSVRLQSLQVSDLTDGTITRLVRKPTVNGSPPARRVGPSTTPRVIVMRGGDSAAEPLLP